MCNQNRFECLRAESGEDHLATMTTEELPEYATPGRDVCDIETDDVGDEDCRKLVYRVMVNKLQVHMERELGAALTWANEHGFKVQNIN